MHNQPLGVNSVRFLCQSCENNPDETIRLRLTGMSHRYASSFETGSTEIPRQRFQLITRLYYRVLESLLRQVM